MVGISRSSESLLLDQFMPAYDVAAAHDLVVRAPPARVAPLLESLDLGGSRLVRVLFALRGLPPAALRLDGMESLGFVVLGRVPHREIVLGLIGRFWRWRERPVRFGAADFTAFDEPGFARAAWNFSLTPAGDGTTRVATETRVLCTDDAARRSFRRYWRLIGPFSGLIRMEALRGLRAMAESGSPAPAPGQPHGSAPGS